MSKQPKKAQALIMTRQMNTRQLRNKDVSRRKIAEMTKMLRRPNCKDSVDDKVVWTPPSSRTSPKKTSPGKPNSPTKQNMTATKPNMTNTKPNMTSTKQNMSPIKPNTSVTKHNKMMTKSSMTGKKSTNISTPPKPIVKTYKGPKSSEVVKEQTSVRGIKIKGYESPQESQSQKEVNKNDFYPLNKKRTIKTEKVVLKPKNELKNIGSKRKVAVPRKGSNVSPKRQKPTTEPSPTVEAPTLTVQDMISAMEQRGLSDENWLEISSKRQNPTPVPPQNLTPVPAPTVTVQDMISAMEERGLSDEDWLEILTCESPVWWEDPPDEKYFEEPILRRNRQTESESNKIINQKTETQTNNLKIPKRIQMDKKFLTKRSKLENVLGNIKIKLVGKVSNPTEPKQLSKEQKTTVEQIKKDENKRTNDDQGDKTSELKENTNKNSEIEENTSNLRKLIDNKTKANFAKTDHKNITNHSRKINKKILESCEDISVLPLDHKMLNDLENMDIPMQDHDTLHNPIRVYLKNSIEGDINKSDGSVNTEEVILNKLGRDDLSEMDCIEIIGSDTKLNIDNFTTELNKSNTKKHVQNDIEDPGSNETDSLPKLTITSIEKIGSSPTSDSNSSVLTQEFDSISDNIQFHEEDQSSINSECSVDKNESKDLENTNAVAFLNINTRKSDSGVFLSNTNENFDDRAFNYEEISDTYDQQQKVNLESVEKMVKLKNNQKIKSKEYMTVYKIISYEDVGENTKNDGLKNQNEVLTKNIENSDVIKIINENEKEKTDSVKLNLNSFYKKCKSLRKTKLAPDNEIESKTSELNDVNNFSEVITPVITENNENADQSALKVKVDSENKEPKSEVNNLCKSCDSSEKSIVISNKNIVKYCLKCSCIFESENCTYCDRKVSNSPKGGE